MWAIAREAGLHLKDGRVISGTTDRPLGRGPTKPLPIHRREGKSLDCAGHAIAAEAAAHAMRIIWHFDTLNDTGSIGGILADGAFNTSTQ